MIKKIREYLGDKADYLLNFNSPKVSKELLSLPSPDFVDKVYAQSDRNNRVLGNLQWMFNHGRLGGTGYLSILPVDQGIEHSAGASFAKNPLYFDPENIIKLAIEGGCNAVASTFGVLSIMSRKYAHKIPFLVKINHNELLTYPNKYDQILFGRVEQAYDMGAAAVGATIYFGSENSNRQIIEVAEAFYLAHELGMATVLWCYLRNSAFKKDKDYHVSADLTGQANHLGVTIEADIIKQKLPENNGGYLAINKDAKFGKYDDKMYSDLTSDHPIDLCRYQVVNNYMGRISTKNSLDSNAVFDDVYFTPLNEIYTGKAFPDMYGTILQANIISMILNRTYIDSMPYLLKVIITVFIVYLNMVIFTFIIIKNKRWYEIFSLAVFVIESIGLLFLSLLSFVYFNYDMDFTISIFSIALSVLIFEMYNSSLKPLSIKLYYKYFHKG